MRSNTTRTAEALFEPLGTESEADTEAIPLLPLGNDDPEDLSDMPHPDTPKTTLFNSFTTTLVGAFTLARLGSNSFSPQRLAFDSISGVPTDSLKAEQCICYFHPKNLSLFDVVLLARVVHHYAPIYDLFQNQCYIFASVIFNTIVQIYSVPAVTFGTNYSSTAVPALTPENGIPDNANMIFCQHQIKLAVGLASSSSTWSSNRLLLVLYIDYIWLNGKVSWWILWCSVENSGGRFFLYCFEFSLCLVVS